METGKTIEVAMGPQREPVRGTHGRVELAVWNAGEREAYVYTSNWNIMQALRWRFGQGAQYVKDGYVLAWQFRTPRPVARMVLRFFLQLRRSKPRDVGRITDELRRELGRTE